MKHNIDNKISGQSYNVQQFKCRTKLQRTAAQMSDNQTSQKMRIIWF
jgi:hypothetical protein